jgi:hypothetical protein
MNIELAVVKLRPIRVESDINGARVVDFDYAADCHVSDD